MLKPLSASWLTPRPVSPPSHRARSEDLDQPRSGPDGALGVEPGVEAAAREAEAQAKVGPLLARRSCLEFSNVLKRLSVLNPKHELLVIDDASLASWRDTGLAS
jgi:hypothetical protein